MKTTDRSQDFITLYLDGELVVLPCAHLDALLEQWMGAGNDSEGFISNRCFLIDECEHQQNLSGILALETDAGRSAASGAE